MTDNTKLLPAATHATRIIGRHLINPQTQTVRIDWPAVTLHFEGALTQTTSIQLRVKGNGLVLGYRLTEQPINDINNNDNIDENEFVIVTSQADKLQDYKLRLLHSNTHNLDPSKSYTLAVWKRDDPYNTGMYIAGLVVDQTCTVTPPNNPCDPNPPSNRKLIEFVGDSNTAARFQLEAKALECNPQVGT